MGKSRTFQVGSLYEPEDIAPLVPILKSVASRSSLNGLVHLYKDRETSQFWVGGPLKGPDSNVFLYLGSQDMNDQKFQKLASELARNSKVVASESRAVFFSGPIEAQLDDSVWFDVCDLFDFIHNK
jgi:hypothetical protein